MKFNDNITYFGRQMRMRLFSRTAMSLALLVGTGIAFAMGGSMLIPALVASIGSFTMTLVNRLYQQNQYEERMVNLYRNEISQIVGVPPEQVTRAHLKEAAKSSEVIDQALQRQQTKTLIALGTSALAAVATFAMLMSFGTTGKLHTWAISTFGAVVGPVANFIGIGTIAGLSSLVLKDGLQFAVGNKMHLGKAVAHDRILDLEMSLQSGRGVTKEQVYRVLVAGDPGLQEAIVQQFGKRYAQMKPRERAQVVETMGAAPSMQQLANQINTGEVKPAHLLLLVEGVEKIERPNTRYTHAAPDEPAPRSNFVERLNLAPRQQQSSFQERLSAERNSVAALRSM